ncbi:general transcription factor II-I repeat domain-containing protein 2A-like isoform X1 [Sceloporus undulatus]|uniref:general transcription factor II-I repeat domain-containing protein 2A-like isoform X1 n=1 Tax=Sceloporus undulatus TaxID=8520 RepID=UPI001C4AEA9F|nr:general transcription factor II-I repeat domain-containing protein 2A-like isoform X1 [Sceloporus undulatus]
MQIQIQSFVPFFPRGINGSGNKTLRLWKCQTFEVTMMSQKVAPKRKIDAECRVFNPQWTEDYFFIEHKEKAVCLICQDTVAVFKEYNLRRHYQTRHKDTYDGFVGQARKDEISKLTSQQNIFVKQKQQNVFLKQKQQNISSMRASYEVAQAIVSAGKSFTEGEFVKDCLLRVVKVICPEKADVFNTLSLSARTISRRVEELGDNLKQQLQNSAKNFSYFSLALGESNNIRDSAQLLVFIRGINDNFEVTEELAALQSIKGTTTGEDIYEMVCQTVNGLELDWAKLASVTTDGTPSMVGSKGGVIACINQDMEKHNHSQPIAIHCLICQQALCSKSLKWDSVMKTVVSCVNFIRANALNHRQFQEFLSEENADCEDVLYHPEMRWLSRGKVLRRFYDLLPEIAAFLVSKNKEVPELNDAEWKWHLAFLTDVTEFLNGLNVEFKRKGKFICDMYASVKSFELKLGLLIKQVNEGRFSHFPTTQNLSRKTIGCIPNKNMCGVTGKVTKRVTS